VVLPDITAAGRMTTTPTHYMGLLMANQPWNLLLSMALPFAVIYLCFCDSHHSPRQEAARRRPEPVSESNKGSQGSVTAVRVSATPAGPRLWAVGT
jgi:hypothetical protein